MVDKALVVWPLSTALFIMVYYFRVIETSFSIQYSTVAVWGAFMSYWTYAAAGDQELSSPAKQQNLKKQQSQRTRIAHVLLFVTSITQLLLTDGINHFKPIPWFTVNFVGWSLSLFGLSWAIWARRTLGKQWRGIVEIRKDHQLIREGPYSVTRHPIYTGLYALSLGCVFLVGGRMEAWISFAVIVAIYLFKLWQEEQLLVQQFGRQYEEYRKQVPKVIPGIHFI